MKTSLNGTRTPPAAPSDKPKGGSVNNEPTRSSTAKTPSTLGPRVA